MHPYTTATGVVCPGEKLKFAENFASGTGTYVRDQHVVAAVVGTVRVVAPAEGDKRPVVEVVRGVGGANNDPGLKGPPSFNKSST